MNMQMKLSDLYGEENPGLAPGNLIVMEPRLVVPSISENLEEVRLSMRKFMDTLKFEQTIKKGGKTQSQRDVSSQVGQDN